MLGYIFRGIGCKKFLNSTYAALKAKNTYCNTAMWWIFGLTYNKPVRAFSFIFIVYLVALLTQPCDEIFPVINRDSSQSVVSCIGNGSTTETTGEECSPFCICSCCSHPVANQVFTIKTTRETMREMSVQMSVEYTNPYTANHFDSIWQPPKA